MGNLLAAINEVPVVDANATQSLKVSLPVDQPRGLIAFANTLQPPTTAQSLAELWIANGSINDFMSDLHRLPATFPNLKELHLVNFSDPDLDREESLFKTQFFTACDQTPLVDRKVFISFLGIGSEDEFRAGIAALCEEQGVRAVYGEGEENSWLTLNKGRGTIVIEKIEEFHQTVEMADVGDEEGGANDGEEDDGFDFNCDVEGYVEENDSDYKYETDQDGD